MTDGNHAATKRRARPRMVRFQLLMPTDLVRQLEALEELEPDLNRSDHVRALLRDSLRRRLAS
jgi:metal-responsive CopG/Arc/MetJ family transcriptional regulator